MKGIKIEKVGKQEQHERFEQRRADLQHQKAERQEKERLEREAAETEQPQLVIEPYGGVNHRLNIVMCVLTCGLWLPIYAIVWLIHGNRKRRIVER